jgi:hypothetical protein
MPERRDGDRRSRVIFSFILDKPDVPSPSQPARRAPSSTAIRAHCAQAHTHSRPSGGARDDALMLVGPVRAFDLQPEEDDVRVGTVHAAGVLWAGASSFWPVRTATSSHRCHVVDDVHRRFG